MTLDTRFAAKKRLEERKSSGEEFKDHANFLLLKKT
jgi:hypothetical protein